MLIYLDWTWSLKGRQEKHWESFEVIRFLSNPLFQLFLYHRLTKRSPLERNILSLRHHLSFHNSRNNISQNNSFSPPVQGDIPHCDGGRMITARLLMRESRQVVRLTIIVGGGWRGGSRTCYVGRVNGASSVSGLCLFALQYFLTDSAGRTGCLI